MGVVAFSVIVYCRQLRMQMSECLRVLTREGKKEKLKTFPRKLMIKKLNKMKYWKERNDIIGRYKLREGKANIDDLKCVNTKLAPPITLKMKAHFLHRHFKTYLMHKKHKKNSIVMVHFEISKK